MAHIPKSQLCEVGVIVQNIKVRQWLSVLNLATDVPTKT